MHGKGGGHKGSSEELTLLDTLWSDRQPQDSKELQPV